MFALMQKGCHHIPNPNKGFISLGRWVVLTRYTRSRMESPLRMVLIKDEISSKGSTNQR